MLVYRETHGDGPFSACDELLMQQVKLFLGRNGTARHGSPMLTMSGGFWPTGPAEMATVAGIAIWP